MPEIPLTKGYATLVDEADFAMLSQWRWRTMDCAGGPYAYRTVYTGGVRGWIIMHRLLLPDAKRVDHANGNGLDNRRINLRPATASQNRANSKKGTGHLSRYKGVTRSEGQRQWRAQIQYHGRRMTLGQFHTEEEAAAAYNEAAGKLFGEYARPNELSTPESK